LLSLGSVPLLLFGSAAPSNEHLGALQHSCVGSPRHATIHRLGSRRTTARPRTTVCGGSTASLGNAARRPGYSRKTVWPAAKNFVRGPEPGKPFQPSGTHPCAAAHGSSGARGCSGSPPLAASPSAALCHSRACTGVRVIRRRDATNRDRNCANLQPRQQFAGQHTPKASHQQWPEGSQRTHHIAASPGQGAGHTTQR